MAALIEDLLNKNVTPLYRHFGAIWSVEPEKAVLVNMKSLENSRSMSKSKGCRWFSSLGPPTCWLFFDRFVDCDLAGLLPSVSPRGRRTDREFGLPGLVGLPRLARSSDLEGVFNDGIWDEIIERRLPLGLLGLGPRKLEVMDSKDSTSSESSSSNATDRRVSVG